MFPRNILSCLSHRMMNHGSIIARDESINSFAFQSYRTKVKVKVPAQESAAAVPQEHTGIGGDVDDLSLYRMGIIDKIKIILGLASPCKFTLSYKKHVNHPNPNKSIFTFRLDCIEMLKITLDDRHRMIEAREWKFSKPIVPLRETIVTENSRVSIRVNGNITLIGNDKLSLTFKRRLLCPTLFKVELKREDVSDLSIDESVAFLFLLESGSEDFNWAVVDTKELKGAEINPGSKIVRSRAEIERLVISGSNLDRVHQYLSLKDNADDRKALLSYMKIAPKKEPEMEREIIRTRFHTMQTAENRGKQGTSVAFSYLMRMLDVINRNDISLRLLQLALLGEELPAP